MKMELSPEVFELAPGFRRAVVIARDIDNEGRSEELELRLTIAMARFREKYTRENFRQTPKLAIWDEIFRKMSVNPNKFPPSITNLAKRTLAGNEIAFISKVVAIMNIVSLETVLPLGGDDLASEIGRAHV